MQRINKRFLFIIDRKNIYLGKLGIYVGDRLEPRLIPALQDGQVIGVIIKDSFELVTPYSVPNFSYRTQLPSSVKLTDDTQRVSKIDESKKFLPVSGVREGFEVELPIS